MFKICKACDIITDKTKKIVSDPSELHSMFKFVSTIEVRFSSMKKNNSFVINLYKNR